MKRFKDTINAFSLLRKAKQNFVILNRRFTVILNLFQDLFQKPLNGYRNRQSRLTCALWQKSAFSLAEAMVVLVIIAIVMAMAAPLIAHKANTDQKRLIFNGVSPHIATAMGNAQNFGIGDNNPNGDNNAKLLVRAKKSDQNLVAKFISNFTPDSEENAAKPIFQVKPASGSKLINENGFQVFADGTTNAGCMPDFDNMEPFNNSTDFHNNCTLTDAYGDTYTGDCYKYVAKENGYIMATRSVNIIGEQNFIPTMVPRQIRTRCVGTGTSDCTTEITQYEYFGAVIAPVLKGKSVEISQYTPPVTDAIATGDYCGSSGCQPAKYNNDRFLPRFIPCVK